MARKRKSTAIVPVFVPTTAMEDGKRVDSGWGEDWRQCRAEEPDKAARLRRIRHAAILREMAVRLDLHGAEVDLEGEEPCVTLPVNDDGERVRLSERTMRFMDLSERIPDRRTAEDLYAALSRLLWAPPSVMLTMARIGADVTEHDIDGGHYQDDAAWCHGEDEGGKYRYLGATKLYCKGQA